MCSMYTNDAQIVSFSYVYCSILVTNNLLHLYKVAIVLFSFKWFTYTATEIQYKPTYVYMYAHNYIHTGIYPDVVLHRF